MPRLHFYTDSFHPACLLILWLKLDVPLLCIICHIQFPSHPQQNPTRPRTSSLSSLLSAYVELALWLCVLPLVLVGCTGRKDISSKISCTCSAGAKCTKRRKSETPPLLHHPSSRSMEAVYPHLLSLDSGFRFPASSQFKWRGEVSLYVGG